MQIKQIAEAGRRSAHLQIELHNNRSRLKTDIMPSVSSRIDLRCKIRSRRCRSVKTM
jgi:hypothetical protein